MFRIPITRRLISSHPLGFFTQKPLFAASLPTTISSSFPTSRTFSTSPLPSKLLRPSIRSSSLSAQPISRLPRRPFSSSSHQRFGSGNNRYRRFNEPPVFHFIQHAKPIHFVMIGGVIGGFYVYNIEEVEGTGRRRFNCFSAESELKMGRDNYREILHENRGRILPDDHPITVSVRNVLERLIPQAPIAGAEWKVHVIDDPGMMNAFVLPGGKVFVYTGILPICKDTDGLAAVLGHEIAHVTAHHTAERMSKHIISLGAAWIVASLFDITGQIPMMILNFLYTLPNSRTQEAEADNIGLMMMSKACFNPEAAVKLWARMHQAEKNAPPQFLSTHPSSSGRMEAIQGWLFKAEAEYENSGCHALRGWMPGFQEAYRSSRW